MRQVTARHDQESVFSHFARMMQPQRRFTARKVALAVLIVLAALAAALLAQRKAATPVPLPLTLAVAENLLDIPVIIAIERGFYTAAGLDIRYRSFIAGRDGLEALLRREVDVAVVAETPLVLKSFERRDFVIIASLNYSYANSRLVSRRDSGIRRVADLRGRRIGIIRGTSAHYFLHAQLEEQGMRREDVVEVPMPPDAMASALAAGQIDAIAAFEPVASQALAALASNGLDITIRGRVRETFNYVTRAEAAPQKAEALARLLRATERAVLWVHEHRAEAILVVAGRLKLDPRVVEALWDNYHSGLYLDQNLLLSLEAQARWAAAAGVAKGRSPNYLEMLDWSPLEGVDPTAVTVIR